MKLLFYGGEHFPENKAVDKVLLQNLNSHMPRFVYIPSCYQDDHKYYRFFKNHFKKLGIRNFLYFPIERKVVRDKEYMERIFNSEVIFLSGGNTFEFLSDIRRFKLQGKFRNFVRKGGILCGASAGGILMTPNIKTAEIPSIDADENSKKIKNLRALSLVDFEFSPHYGVDCHLGHRELLEYSRVRSKKILACEDGAGIWISGRKRTYIGKVYMYHKGKKTKLSN